MTAALSSTGDDLKVLAPAPGPMTVSPRYRLISDRLRYEGACVIYRGSHGTVSMDLAALILPPTVGSPKALRLSDEPAYVDIALALADRRLALSKSGTPLARTLTRQFYLLRHVLDWLRMRGVYRLADASPADTAALLTAVARDGWSGALDLAARWHQALDGMTPEAMEGAFHYKVRGGGRREIETLFQPFWRARIGWGGIVPLHVEAKVRLEAMMAPAAFTDSWHARQASAVSPPRSHVLRNVVSWLNDLASLPDGVDRWRHRVALDPSQAARRLGAPPSSRTANLALDDAVALIDASLRLVYEVAPTLIELLTQARALDAQTCELGERRREAHAWLMGHPLVPVLNARLSKPIGRWVASGSYAKSAGHATVDEVVGAVQGACAVVLAAMNARRQREVCDPVYGVRVGDLTILDEELGLYQTQFYIEKTYFARHPFYVNRTSADALRCLESLKSACLPDGHALEIGASLFACGRRNAAELSGEAHLSFTQDTGRTRSLISFFRLGFACETTIAVSAHMFRRFYALLYFHQYEHAELRSLRQQLRHMDVARTRVYVTDPASRPLAEQIRSRLGTQAFAVSEEAARAAMEASYADMEAAWAEVEQEKLHQAVAQVLAGEATAGGFSRLVRTLYRRMLPSVTVGGTSPEVAVGERLQRSGYGAKPMMHGQCHAPSRRRPLKGRCEGDEGLAREYAGPVLCQSCPYHFNNEAYVLNLEEDRERLIVECDDVLLPPLQQARAAYDLANLERVITQTRTQMAFNAGRIQAMASGEGGSAS